MKKKAVYGKKIGGWVADFGLTFRKYLPDPLPEEFAFIMILPGQINSVKNTAVGASDRL